MKILWLPQACKQNGAWQHSGVVDMQGQRRSWLGILSPLPQGCRCDAAL